jgi:hypothetical protein
MRLGERLARCVLLGLFPLRPAAPAGAAMISDVLKERVKMRIRRWLAVTAIATSAVALFAGAAVAAAPSASPTSARPTAVAVSAGALAPGSRAQSGWQGAFTYLVPAGVPSLFFHYACPRSYVAVSGAFHDLSTPGPDVDGSFPRTDVKPFYSQWGFLFSWPHGAPSGFKMQFNVYCQK